MTDLIVTALKEEYTEGFCNALEFVLLTCDLSDEDRERISAVRERGGPFGVDDNAVDA